MCYAFISWESLQNIAQLLPLLHPHLLCYLFPLFFFNSSQKSCSEDGENRKRWRREKDECREEKFSGGQQRHKRVRKSTTGSLSVFLVICLCSSFWDTLNLNHVCQRGSWKETNLTLWCWHEAVTRDGHCVRSDDHRHKQTTCWSLTNYNLPPFMTWGDR